MSKNLMIIESPNKIKTISHYLKNQDMELLATYGHLRDLNKFGMGFNRDLDPNWVIVETKKINDKNNKKEILKTIRDAAKAADKIYLSTDPDREGEAIAWHVWSLLPEEDQKKCVRVVFNEITDRAIHEALNHPRQIDLSQVNSYLARRLLDRNFGYKLSGFVRQFLGGISAGRVQSVALKFLQIRENEIRNFIPESWFTINVLLKNKLNLTLRKLGSNIKNYKLNENINDGKVNFHDALSAQNVIDQLNDEYIFVKEHAPKEEKINAKPALKTSTLQQEAISRFKISSKLVESTAQKLYEGVEINGQMYSLITYPRTDRTDLSETFVDLAKTYIKKTFGADYWKGVQVKKTTKKNQSEKELVQGAHEAIRPSDLSLTPEIVKPYLDKTKFQVYCLIWTRALASLMSQAVYQYQYYDFENNGCLFNNYTRVRKFDGFERVFDQYKLRKTNVELDETNEEENIELNQTAKLVLNEAYPLKTIDVEQHDKKPPARFNEASLIRALEKEGIGRPSTYATIANTVLKRDYAQKQNSALVPTDVGMKIVERLQDIFPNIMSFDFTRKMEEGLDEIASDKVEWKNFLKELFTQFQATLTEAKKNQPPVEPEYVGRLCPLCEHQLIYRKSYRTANPKKFIGCSNYPKCRFVEPLVKPVFVGEDCELCQSPLVRRTSRYGNTFFGCSTFPKCRFIKDDPENPKPLKNQQAKKTTRTKTKAAEE
ncbi:DNA topoisomerase-1 [Mycoplasmoides fastidiosum]|uniref:DNA topoisomerase 1 n=1 Tax=Mycoplasmoides fastidiosum TaxID=92758 RepID=A0ABU0LZ30_9BACT|nr:type I DNA topoisomerase [Mycoplasmoides fastidiosum]MDQ0513944.1 DNA topoisomerase-1 [Mycoplasmoides fastidiosum]UUD37642.1 type I DNA topoisomerase [Mycoplasmoides fastidiosum]